MKREIITEFEKVILDKENGNQIKYSVDRGIEASVKYDFLCEKYGKERVDLFLSDLQRTFVDLSDESFFLQLQNQIEENKVD